MSQKTKSTSIIILLIIIAFSLISAKPGADFLTQLKLQLARFTSIAHAEKVYLNTDKPMYFPGEDIWLEAFIVDGTNSPSKISEVVYVELIDPRNNVLEKLTLAANGATAKGDFHLDKDIAGGLYKLRAYTLWMRNFSEEEIFEKKIHIQNFIAPNLLLKLDFEKENYSPGEEGIAIFEARDLEDSPLKNQEVNFQVNYKGVNAIASTCQTDEEGKAEIKISLPDSLQSRDALLNVLISHEGSEESISRAIPIALQKINLTFYPEGGYLISGVKNTIAFEALNEYGKSVDIKGKLMDSRQKIIAPIESYHMGMGKFELKKPESGYFLKITSPGLKQDTFLLPNPIEMDYSMHLEEQTKENLKFSIRIPKNMTGYLVGRIHEKIRVSKQISGSRSAVELNINTKKFPGGILVFTLFNQDELEMSERLVFVNPDQQLNVNIEPNKKRYGTREKVKLSITTTDQADKPVEANISLAVVDDRIISFADDRQDHLVSYLLLSSELKGEIKEPRFYFDPMEPKAPMALDLLMLTHGWRRFTWESINADPPEITYAPENFSSIVGAVVNMKTSKPVKTPVYLFEMNNENRMAKVKTNKNGVFKFYNVDPTATIELVARSKLKKEKNWQILMNSIAPAKLSSQPKTQKGFEIGKEYDFIPIQINQPVRENESRQNSQQFGQSTTQVNMEADMTALSEIIVVGYGSTRASSITGSISTIYSNDLNPPYYPIEQMLSGRISGVTVAQHSPTPGTNNGIRIRGLNILSGKQPLYVIDGMLIPTNGGDFSSLMDYLHVSDIESVSVLKAPEASAVFGSRASNGAIIVQTNKDRSRYRNNYLPQSKNYANKQIANYLKRSATREFYSPNYKAESNATKTDLRQTIYWKPAIKTNEDGKAVVEFCTSDALTTFRAIAEGLGTKGLVGHREVTFASGDPINLDFKIPAYAIEGDIAKLAMQIYNTSEDTVTGILSLQTNTKTIKTSSTLFPVTIPPNSSTTKILDCEFMAASRSTSITAWFTSNDITKKISKSTKIYQRGFPVETSLSGASMSKSFSFDIDDAVPGTLLCDFTAFTNEIGELFSGVESMLRTPHGCFEQVSSSTYPNILILQLMEELKINNDENRQRALDYIAKGYRKLRKYELPGGGFEWFGHPPAHEGLTAFGLMEFVEMQKVYPKVDQKLIDRTKKWLLKRRDGEGNFKQNKGKYGFSGASQQVTNAYLVYALASCEVTNIELEYKHAVSEAKRSRDMYRMALMLNAAAHLKKQNDYHEILEILKRTLGVNSLDKMKAEHSIVRSYGNSLNNEIKALLLLGLLNQSSIIESKTAKKLFDDLISSRKFGGFGSTQATVLSLQAIVKYAQKYNRTREDGNIQILVNGNTVANRNFYKNSRDDVIIKKLEQHFSSGNQRVGISFTDCSNPLNYSMNLSWRTSRPSSSSRCSIDLQTAILNDSVKINETARLLITITNNEDVGKPMTMACVGIPGGTSLQHWQLELLLDEKKVDFYEIIDGYIVLYFKEMGPNEMKNIHLDLRAEIPGTYRGQASSSYLYYLNEEKDWEYGNSITILE